MVPTNEIYKINEDVAIEKLENGIAATRLGADRLYIFNTTGCAIWDLLDGHTTLDVITSSLAARFGQAPDIVSQEVNAFVDRLLAAGLIGGVQK